jgi:hypothetical protein
MNMVEETIILVTIDHHKKQKAKRCQEQSS